VARHHRVHSRPAHPHHHVSNKARAGTIAGGQRNWGTEKASSSLLLLSIHRCWCMSFSVCAMFGAWCPAPPVATATFAAHKAARATDWEALLVQGKVELLRQSCCRLDAAAKARETVRGRYAEECIEEAARRDHFGRTLNFVVGAKAGAAMQQRQLQAALKKAASEERTAAVEMKRQQWEGR
jgi:hypothetical protein